MYPMQLHEIRSVARAEALRAARQTQMAGAIQVRRPRLFPALIARLSPLRRQEMDCSGASYAPSPC